MRPRTIEEIRKEFHDQLADLKHLTLYDYFRVFKASNIGLHTFQIESITNIDSISEKGEDGYMLDVIITYFVSQKLDENEYITISDKQENDIIDDDKQEAEDEMEQKEEKIGTEEKDELNLDEFFELSEIAATQEREETQLDVHSLSNYSDITQSVNDEVSQERKLFDTEYEITDKCQNLLDSLCDKWMKGEDNYVIGDWRIQNGHNLDYNGMAQTRGSAPRRLKRGIKRVWS